MSVLLLFSCTNERNDVLTEDQSSKACIKKTASNGFSLGLTNEDQDALALEFSTLFSNEDCIDLCRTYLGESGDRFIHIKLDPNWFYEDTTSESELPQLLYDQLLTYDNGFFAGQLEHICYDNYLRLNVYIPNSYYTLLNYSTNDDIYVFNALYRDALIPTEDYRYKASYVITNGQVNPADTIVSEDFANQHLCLFLSFRDRIFSWEHFSTGTQSLSDPLIESFVHFSGYGCTDRTEIDNELADNYNLNPEYERAEVRVGIRNEIGKCVLAFGLCITIPLPVNVYLDEEMFQEFVEENDPYRTIWMPIYPHSEEQYIKVTSNELDLDLRGSTLPVSEQRIKVCGDSIYIPAQCASYSESMESYIIRTFDINH